MIKLRTVDCCASCSLSEPTKEFFYFSCSLLFDLVPVHGLCCEHKRSADALQPDRDYPEFVSRDDPEEGSGE